MKKIILAILLIIVCAASYVICRNSIFTPPPYEDELYLPEISLPDIPDIGFILYDMVSSSDSLYSSESSKYYYFQIAKVSESENDGERKSIYSINIRCDGTVPCKDDTIIGYIAPWTLSSGKCFLLTSTDLPVYLERWEFFMQKSTKEGYGADSIFTCHYTLEHNVSPDGESLFVEVPENGDKVAFDINKWQ